VRLGGYSEPGRVRTVNQDSYFVGEIPGKGYLAAVADGMGGHQTGEVASQKAVSILRQEVLRSRVQPPAAIAKAVQSANLEVFNYALAHPEHRGMGTTLTTVFLDDQVGLVGHVGDSRAYLIRDGDIRQLTHDHSWVADRVRQGLLTAAEAKRHRWRNVITNALGATPSFKLDILHFEVQKGDRLLLCSDGISMLLSEIMMMQIVTDYPPEQASRELVYEANDRGSPDNVTAVVLEVSELEENPKRYTLPPHYRQPASVSISESESGIRKIEKDFPIRDLFTKLREKPWYPYRLWIVGGLYLILLFLLFSLWPLF
jgi:protein phosphatase